MESAINCNFLNQLLEPTPSGVSKLIAVWDGLSDEIKISILMELKSNHNRSRNMASFVDDKIYTKALDSLNPYIRYLAAKRLMNSELEASIKNDSDPLVKYCGLESPYSLNLPEASDFFQLPQEARIAAIRKLIGGSEEFSKLIQYALDKKKSEKVISSFDLIELIMEYVNRDLFKKQCKDFLYRKEDIEVLWELVVCLPKNIGSFLVRALPSVINSETCIPESVLEAFSDAQLNDLFFRNDVDLKEFRKSIFCDIINKKRNVYLSACCNHFFYEEVYELEGIRKRVANGEDIEEIFYSYFEENESDEAINKTDSDQNFIAIKKLNDTITYKFKELADSQKQLFYIVFIILSIVLWKVY